MLEKEMSFWDHLDELRKRILISLATILIITSVALIYADTILKVLLIPAGGMRLNPFGLMDGFMIKFRIAQYIGIAAAFPLWIKKFYIKRRLTCHSQFNPFTSSSSSWLRS
jgi:sec-independent protein translocase protein TatC